MRTQTSPDTIPAVDRPLEDGWTLPASWYTDSTRPAARARADLRPRVGVRRPDGVGDRAGLVLRRADRTHPGRRRPRIGRRPARPRERLPTPGAPRRRGHRVPGDAAVPVPRLDVRPRRHARARAALGSRAGLRPDGSLARARSPSARGGRSSSRTPIPTLRRSTRGSARSRRSSRRAASTSTRSASTRTTSGRSRRTGRS